MKNQVIRFVESEIECGNEVIISTRGNGGAGLTLISDIMLVQELEEMKYAGSNQPAEDIEHYEAYDPETYNVHRFNGENGFYILVATYGIDASKDITYTRNKKKFTEAFQAMRCRTAAVGDREIGIVFLEEDDIMYAGGITNNGVFREFEIEIDYDFSLDVHLCELISMAEEGYFEEMNNNDN